MYLCMVLCSAGYGVFGAGLVIGDGIGYGWIGGFGRGVFPDKMSDIKDLVRGEVSSFVEISLDSLG